MGSVGDDLGTDAAYLPELVHKVDAVVQTAGCIDDSDVGTAGDRRLDGIESNRGRIRTHSLSDYVHSGTFGPDDQLVHRSGAEGIGRTEDDLLALALEEMRELAYGGGLAHAVDSYHEYDIGLLGEVGRRSVPALFEQVGNLLAQESYQFVEGCVLVPADALFQGIDHLQGGIYAHIGLHQSLFYGVEGVVIDPRFAGDSPGYLLKETECHVNCLYSLQI